MVGLAVAGQHEAVGAGVRSVQQAEAVRGRLDVQVRPDRPVDRGEGAEALHHLGIGLVQQIPGQRAVVGGIEVAVGQQKRELERRPLRQLEFPLAFIAHDPEAREAGVDAEAGHAHHVVVVPEHCRPLVVRIRVERLLAGHGQVLGPAVARGIRHRAVEVDDGEARQCGRRRIGRAAASARRALRGHTVDCVIRRDGDEHRQRAGEVVLPLNLERHAAVDLDRRSGQRAVVRPDPRGRKLAMEPMGRRFESNDQPGRLADDSPRRDRELVDERRQRVIRTWRHVLATRV
jgi:hypothetical protein